MVASVHVQACDMASMLDATKLFTTAIGILMGMWHAAGVVADQMLQSQTIETHR